MDKRGEKLAVGIFKALRAPGREAGWLQGRTGGLHFAISRVTRSRKDDRRYEKLTFRLFTVWISRMKRKHYHHDSLENDLAING